MGSTTYYISKEDDLDNDIDDIEIPIIIGTGKKGDDDSDNGTPNTGGKTHVRTDIAYLFKRILKTAIEKIVKGLGIDKIYHELVNIIPNPIIDLLAYITSLLDSIVSYSICHWYVPLLSAAFIYSLKTIYIHVMKYYILEDSNYLDIIMRLTTSCVATKPAFFRDENMHRLANQAWIDVPSEIISKWWGKENQMYQLSRIHRIMASLGFTHCPRYSQLSEHSLILESYLAAGLKYCSVKQFASVLVQVGIMTYNKCARTYLWGVYNVLVMFGVGVVVWFKLHPYPVDFDPYPVLEVLYPKDAFQLFKNPNTSGVDGWNRVVYHMLHDDLVNRVLSIYRNQPPFCDILPPSEYVLDDVGKQQRYAAVGTAIIIATYIGANLVMPGGIDY